MMDRWRRWVLGHRILASMIITGPLLLWTHSTLSSMLWGLPLVLLGAAMRLWSLGIIRKDNAVAVDGPYAWVRNPLYLGNFFLGLGIALMGRNLPVLTLYLVAFYVVYTPVIQAEEESLRYKFGATYLSYFQRTPRFFPSLAHKPSPFGARFSWQLVVKHREYRAWIGLLVILALLALRLTFT